MGLLTRDDLRRHSPLAWLCAAAVAAMASAFHAAGRGAAALGTLAALGGCLALILPPRERMAALPRRLRHLPRWLDAVPLLMTLLVSPGFGLGWFYGANPYDEVVHLANGVLGGLVLAGVLHRDARMRRQAWRALLGALAGLAVAVAWEGFEWSTGLIGDLPDTVSDILLTASGTALGVEVGMRLLVRAGWA